MPEVDGRGQSVFHRQGKGHPSLGEEGIERPFQGANGDKIDLCTLNEKPVVLQE